MTLKICCVVHLRLYMALSVVRSAYHIHILMLDLFGHTRMRKKRKRKKHDNSSTRKVCRTKRKSYQWMGNGSNAIERDK